MSRCVDQTSRTILRLVPVHDPMHRLGSRRALESTIAPMPYIEGRIVHDADAHIMETPTWLIDHADPSVRDRIEPLQMAGGNELKQTGDPEEQLRDLDRAFEKL